MKKIRELQCWGCRCLPAGILTSVPPFRLTFTVVPFTASVNGTLQQETSYQRHQHSSADHRLMHADKVLRIVLHQSSWSCC